MGYSIRTDRYRYTEWYRFNTDSLVVTELYDHRTDSAETINIAGTAGAALRDSLHTQLQTQLHSQLRIKKAGSLAGTRF
jgi:iduronate 2-sulfatase